MAADAPPKDLERLSALLDEAAASRRRARIAGRLGAVTLFCLIAGFLWSFWSMAVTRFRRETLEPPLQAELDRLRPVFAGHAEEAAKRILPAYERLARERMETTLPLLKSAIDAEWQVLEASIASKAKPELEAAVRRIEERQWARLRTRVPRLDSDEARQEFVDRWMHRVLEDHRAILGGLERKVGGEIVALADSADTFRPSRFDSWERERLTRHLVHLLLQRLDRHILSMDEPHAIDEGHLELGVTPAAEEEDGHGR
jgi:hypothetical protein